MFRLQPGALLLCCLSKGREGSHQRICDIISELPSRDSDKLELNYDREKVVDLDAGLKYGKKYMRNLTYLHEIDWGWRVAMQSSFPQSNYPPY